MSTLRERCDAAREKLACLETELARLETELARQEAPTRVRVATAGELFHALRDVPQNAELSFDDGDDGPYLEARYFDTAGEQHTWLFLLPGAPDEL